MYENTPAIATISDAQTLNQAIDEFTKIIIEAADATIPKFAPTPPSLRTPPQHILNLIKQRNNIKNTWYRTKNPTLRPILNSLTTQIHTLMRMWNTSLWHETLRLTHGDHRKFWKLVRTKITKRHSVLLQTSNSVMDHAEQAELIATHMSTESQSRTTAGEEAPRMEHGRNFMYTSPKQLSAILRRTKGGKSPGLDRVQYVLLRQLPRRSLAYLTHLLNSCIRLRHYPTQWKHAVVVPLLKPTKNGLSPDHYRPISLLSHISKLLEKVILQYLTDFCKEKNIIPPEQAGFATGVSTLHPLAKLQHHASTHLNINHTTAMISIDCTKAFDSVNHKILLDKLQSHDCPEQLYNIIHSFLHDRTFQTRVGTSLSHTYPLPCGVPQGSVLAPNLFTIYTSDVVQQHYPRTHISAYADDIAIYSSSINPARALSFAERACQDISNRLRNININVNPNKTDALIFAYYKGKRKPLPKHFTLDGTNIKISRKIHYLGIHLDRHLHFSGHINSKLKSTRTRYNSLRHLLFTPNLSLRLKVLIYKGVIRPALLYGSPLFRYLTKTSLKRLQSFQNAILRRIVRHTPHYTKRSHDIQDLLQVESVTHYIKKQHIKFFDSLQYLSNPLFSSITPPPIPTNWQKTSSPFLIDITTTP